MVITIYTSLIGFIVSLIVSSLVIFIATKIFGEQEGFSTAILAAFIGAIIYSFAHYFLGAGNIANLIGGIAWVIALASLYDIGWLKSFIIAIVIWGLANIVGILLPTIAGPL